MVKTITWKTKGKAKEKSKDGGCARTKERRELVPLMVGSYFTHNHFNVVVLML
jgi:hypothetical protein